MAIVMDQNKDQKAHYKTTNAVQKEYILKKCKFPNTNKATKLWVNCFENYLIEKGLPKADGISNDELPEVLENFYIEVKRCNKNSYAEKMQNLFRNKKMMKMIQRYQNKRELSYYYLEVNMSSIVQVL